MKRSANGNLFCVPILILALTGCKKEATESAAPTPVPPPGQQAQIEAALPSAPSPPRLRPVRDATYGIYMRGSWTLAAPDEARMKQIGAVTTITLCQEPAEAACVAVDYAGVVDYLESMRKTAIASGMADIPFHFAVDRAGGAWQLRELKYEGEYAPGRSVGNVGVLVLGSPYAPMTEYQRQGTRKLIGVLSQKFGVPLRGVVARDEIVRGDLPGADVKSLVAEIRRAQMR